MTPTNDRTTDAYTAACAVEQILTGIETLSNVMDLLDEGVLAAVHRALDFPGEGAVQQLAATRDEYAVRVNKIAASAPNHQVAFDGLGVVEARWTGTNTKWDGRRLAHVVGARAVDRSRFDPATGALLDDPLPPSAFAAFIVDEIVACAGLDNASGAWRKGELKKRSINPAQYSDRSGESRATARWIA